MTAAPANCIGASGKGLAVTHADVQLRGCRGNRNRQAGEGVLHRLAGLVHGHRAVAKVDSPGERRPSLAVDDDERGPLALDTIAAAHAADRVRPSMGPIETAAGTDGSGPRRCPGWRCADQHQHETTAQIGRLDYRGGRQPKAIVHSDGQGKYAIDLPTGSYSILVEDNGRQYCNSLSRGQACAVTIPAGEQVRRDLEIDHGSF